ncbi:hypothetical protein FHG87_000025 [Trinorchestia longiramus]|nr:hypothetical protein FHG87_000025 [Trinorchestia longiramus]
MGCCCCCTNYTCCLVLALANMAIGVLGLISRVIGIQTLQVGAVADIFEVIVSVLSIIAGAILLMAVREDLPWLMFPFLAWVSVEMVTSGVGAVVVVILFARVPVTSFLLSVSLLSVLILTAHSFLVVRSYQIEIQEKMKSRDAEEKKSSNEKNKSNSCEEIP